LLQQSKLCLKKIRKNSKQKNKPKKKQKPQKKKKTNKQRETERVLPGHTFVRQSKSRLKQTKRERASEKGERVRACAHTQSVYILGRDPSMYNRKCHNFELCDISRFLSHGMYFF